MEEINYEYVNKEWIEDNFVVINKKYVKLENIKLNEYQLQILNHYINNQKTEILTERQIGTTTILNIIAICEALSGKNILFLSFNSKISKENIKFTRLQKKIKEEIKEISKKTVKFKNGCNISYEEYRMDLLLGNRFDVIIMDNLMFSKINTTQLLFDLKVSYPNSKYIIDFLDDCSKFRINE